MKESKSSDRLYSNAVREMVKHCKHWGYDDSNDDVIDEYLNYMRKNSITLPEDVIEELEYTNINKNDYYRVFAEITYETNFFISIDKKELLSNSIDKCIEEKLLSSLKTDEIIKSLEIFKFKDGFTKKVIHVPLFGKTLVFCSGQITFSSNNTYDIKEDSVAFLHEDQGSYSSWFEQKKMNLIEKLPVSEKIKGISIKTFYLKDIDIILDSSYNE